MKMIKMRPHFTFSFPSFIITGRPDHWQKREHLCLLNVLCAALFHLWEMACANHSFVCAARSLMDRQIGGSIRKYVTSGQPEKLRELLEIPGNLAYINSQGIVSLFVNLTTTTSHFSR
jgi:hypothetical protein